MIQVFQEDILIHLIWGPWESFDVGMKQWKEWLLETELRSFVQASNNIFTKSFSYAYGKHGLGEILPGGSDAVLEFELLGINENKLP